MKKKVSAMFLICVFLIGLFLAGYPIVSQWWNAYHQQKRIVEYQENVQTLAETNHRQIWEEAVAYQQGKQMKDDTEVSTNHKQYQDILNVDGNGMMGYLEIPTIDVELPIYHGVEQDVLQVGLGHLPWSSLPIGGENTHCVISGHRGLANATLLSNLNEVKEGDLFYIRILNQVLTYAVDQILVVEPENIEPLMPTQGKDFCTLVTCTPYGVNSHRLLVRGHRVETTKERQIDGIADTATWKLYITIGTIAVLTCAVAIYIKKIRGYRK